MMPNGQNRQLFIAQSAKLHIQMTSYKRQQIIRRRNYFIVINMFPSVKVKEQLKQKTREQTSSDQKGKFGLNSPTRQKQSSSSKKLSVGDSAGPNKLADFSSNKKKGTQKTYFERKLQLLSRIRQRHEEQFDEVKTFEQLLNKSGAPNFYSYFSLMPLLDLQDIKSYILSQTKKLRQKTSAFHRISTAVRARDQCLDRLKKNLLRLKENELLEKAGELAEQINHLRLLTVNVIEEVKVWRDQLGRTQQKPIYMKDDHKNYLVEMLNDNKFVFLSTLGNVINFGEKNDPFIIAPLKKADGKEKSAYNQIIKTEKELSYFQKYMEYLASEKAYQIGQDNQTPTKKGKTNSIHKIYASNQRNQLLLVPVEQKLHEDEDLQALQRQRLREQRLKRNQERINSIKSIYQNYSTKKRNLSEKKIAESDNQQKRETFKFRNTSKKNEGAQSDFEGLVKIKLELQQNKNQDKFPKQEKVKRNKDKKSVSMSKLPKQEDKMINNLKQIQQTLKNKLEVVQRENKLQESPISSKYLKKNNQELVNWLKTQIIEKIEKETQQKQRLKKKKRQEEQKALEEIKQKMKKQMEQKIEQKKREKLLQRQELQKRLRDQQQRLNNQRQLEIQLQAKLNKEREIRELERVRKNGLEKEKKYKEELQKQQKLRKQREQIIKAQKRQKQMLLQQLRKKDLKDQIEQDLRRQLKARQGPGDQSPVKQELQALKKEKQNQLIKQIQLLKLKEKEQMSLLEKESSIRERMLRLKKEEEELKRMQVENLMKNVIQKEKQQINYEALERRIELEESMRANIKQKMLQQYKSEREAAIQANKMRRQKQLEQQVYRQKVREKIEKQMRMQAINRTKKDLEEREAKKYEMRTKLETLKNNIQVVHKIDKQKIEEEVKKDVVEKVIFDKNMERQNAKLALRAQFQQQLLSSSIPQIYETRESFLLKKTEQLTNQEYLNKKMQATAVKPTNQKPSSQQKPLMKSQIRDVRTIVTNQQLQIFSKQKSKLSEMRQEPLHQPPTKLIQQQEEGYELMNPSKSYKQNQTLNSLKISRKQIPKPSEEVYKKKKKRNEDDSEGEQQIRRKKIRKTRKQESDNEERSSLDSQQEQKLRKNKRSKLHKKRRQRESEQQEQYQDKLRRSPSKSPTKKRLEFGTSQEERQKARQSIVKSKIKKTTTQHQNLDVPKEENRSIIHYDVEKIKQPNLSQIEPITIKKSPIKNVQGSSKFEVSLDAIPEAQLDEYLDGHFARLPEQQIKVQNHDREELYRKLIGEVTFCLMLGHREGKLAGMAFAYHDRNRSDLRKFVIVHIGTYNPSDLKQFIVDISNFIFRKDPCDEVEFFYKYNESSEQQLMFSTQFNKWFDKYGNIYQKKLDGNNYERKYSLKRQFNQKCEVVLGGVNKNIFRNIFSVYSGVVMSDADMVQFKEQLRETASPEDEISYAIMIAQLFRTYLTPDEAEALKGKVKQFVKLKQLLVLVVMLQKKKVKMDELKLYEYKSLIELNMRLMSQGKDVIRYCKDSGVQHNRVFFCELNHSFNLPFNFQTTSLPVQTKENQTRQVSYFRLAALPPYKLHIIRSSVYNGQMNILPTENSKYKMFVMSAQEYMEMADSNKMDLFMYIRLFLKNVKSHNVAVWKYVWMPEMTDKGSWNVREFKSFLNKDIYAHDAVNISYRQFLPGALIIEPDHRDLVITPPFIVGIMSMTLEQVTEGSPLYARLINIDALRTIEIE